MGKYFSSCMGYIGQHGALLTWSSESSYLWLLYGPLLVDSPTGLTAARCRGQMHSMVTVGPTRLVGRHAFFWCMAKRPGCISAVNKKGPAQRIHRAKMVHIDAPIV